MSTGDRPQDVGRPHHRRGGPAPETVELLERYRAAMRAELEELLDELRPAAGEQLTIDGKPMLVRPKLEARRALWDLAIRLARELGAAIEELPPEPGATIGPAPAGPKRAPRLSARDRRALG